MEYRIAPVDVWRGVWRCMHVKSVPQTPHPLTWDRLNRPVSEQGSMRGPVQMNLFYS